MALILPGPMVTLSTITSNTVTFTFDDPDGVTVASNYIAWSIPGGMPVLVGPADANNQINVTVTTDTFITAMGFSYDGSGNAYGPGNILTFTAPHNIFPSFLANHEGIIAIINGLTTKVTADEFIQYANILDGRIDDIQDDQKTLSSRIDELFAAVTAVRRRLLNP